MAALRRYVALLRGVTPMNAKMPELRRCFEATGFENVVTVLASGNVVFDASRAPESTLERDSERAIAAGLGRDFLVIVRAQDKLRTLLDADPFARFRLPPGAKRVVTFLRRAPKSKPALPVEVDGARILAMRGSEVLTAYVPSARGPVFMTLIKKTFGGELTTRTWDTVRKLASK